MRPRAIRFASLEALLEHLEWARGLAGRLVADAARADDVVQSALAAAVKSTARDATNLRGGWAKMTARTSTSIRGDFRVELDAGQWHVCEVSEEGTTIVLNRGKSENRRTPITWTGERVQVLRP